MFIQQRWLDKRTKCKSSKVHHSKHADNQLGVTGHIVLVYEIMKCYWTVFDYTPSNLIWILTKEAWYALVLVQVGSMRNLSPLTSIVDLTVIIRIQKKKSKGVLLVAC
jgi:hypothetical protein